MSSTLEHDPRVVAERTSLGGMIADYGRRISRGDIGQLPVIVGLVVIAIIFQHYSKGIFLTPFNIVNLTFQMAATGTISVGIVLVLLLGEIDLSAGVVSGMCAAIMAVASVRFGWPASVSVGLGLLAGVGVGALQGAWSTILGIPSFIVSLAGLIAWQGAQLLVLGKTGTINLHDPVVIALSGTFVKGSAAYGLTLLFVLYVGVGPMITRLRRKAAGLSVPPIAFGIVRAVGVAAVSFGAVAVLDADRGLSSGMLFLVAAVLIVDFILRRVRFGRMVYAIGGNAEAARRAGMPVKRVRTAVFMLASGFAAWGGILTASRSLAVNQSQGSGSVLLNAIAAAVIGGTSLFGGRGSVWSALLGITVIQSISNGMDLLSLSSGIKFMITGAVLLSTVTIDAVLRRSNTTR